MTQKMMQELMHQGEELEVSWLQAQKHQGSLAGTDATVGEAAGNNEDRGGRNVFGDG